MPQNLLEYLRAHFTPAITERLAHIYDEPEPKVRQTVTGALPTLVSGFMNRLRQPDGPPTLDGHLQDAAFTPDMPFETLVDDNRARYRAEKAGHTFSEKFYGDHYNEVTNELAAFAGVRPTTAVKVMGLATSVLLGELRRRVQTENLTPTTLAAALQAGNNDARLAIPPALVGGMGWFIGNDTVKPGRSVEGDEKPAPVAPLDQPGVQVVPGKKVSFWRWLLWGAAIVAIFALLLQWLRNCERKEQRPAPAVADVRVAVDLPNGRKLNVAKNSFNYQLAQYLADPNRKPERVFTFDNLTFETNSARITERARPNVVDLIEIMQAYPTLHIRIEGHTDNVGSEDVNDALSAERAEVVKQALVDAGIEAGRVTTREQGDDKPVASNETAGGRARNRRIDVVITKL